MMKRNANICKVVSASLALLASASPVVYAMEPSKETGLPSDTGQLRDHNYYKQKLQKLEESTRRIHTEVDRILVEFRNNMKEYYLRTKGTGTADKTQGQVTKEVQITPPIKVPAVVKPVKTEGKLNEAEAVKLIKEESERRKERYIGLHGRLNVDNVPLRLDLTDFRDSLTDNVLREVVDLIPEVQALDLAGCNQITDKGMRYLKGMKALTRLYLQDSDITDTGLQYLENLNLTHLHLGGCKNITNDGLKYLKGMKNLNNLDLSRCNITDAGLKDLGDLEKLIILNLLGCIEITDTGVGCNFSKNWGIRDWQLDE